MKKTLAATTTLKQEISDFSFMVFSTDQFPYDMIQDACNSKWCHIGMTLILTDAQLQTLIEDYTKKSNAPKSRATCDSRKKTTTAGAGSKGLDYYLFESTTDKNRCVVTGKYESSIKLSLLRDRACKYTEPELGYKKSRYVGPNAREGSSSLKTKLLRDVLPELLGRPYESNMCNLVKAWLHWLCCSPRGVVRRGGIDDQGSDNALRCFYKGHAEDTMFCTEAIIHVLTELNVMKAYHGEDVAERSKKTPPITVDEYGYAIIKINLDEESRGKMRKEESTTEPRNVESRCCGAFGYGGYTDEDPIIVDLIELEEYSPYMNEDSPLDYDRLYVYKHVRERKNRYKEDDEDDGDNDDLLCFLKEWEKTSSFYK